MTEHRRPAAPEGHPSSSERLRRTRCRLRLAPLALAAMLAAGAMPATAVVTVTGDFSVYPSFIAVGPGDTDLLGNTLGLGNAAIGDVLVDGGSRLSAASIRFADGGTGVATGLFTGAGTRVALTGDGNTNRLELGAWGRGALTVADGATLDGRADAAACLLGANWCHNFIGNAAGSDATLTVTGAGSNASFLRSFVVGGLAVFRPPIETFTFGTPGGSTRGAVNLLAGGMLTTEGAQIGVGPGGSSPLGSERSFADVVIRGTASTWMVTEGVLEARDASFTMATHRNAWATTTIDQGGTLRVEGSDARFSLVNVGSGGRADMVVRGAGSSIHFTQRNGLLQVGRAAGGTGSLEIVEGGAATGVSYTAVARNGGFGTLTVDGTGSLLRMERTLTAAANGNSGAPGFDIGRNGGNGTVNVRNGGRVEMVSSATTTNGFGLSLGRDAASAGTLNIAAGTVLMAAQSVAPDSAAETWNPFVRVGRDGQGTLTITGGGQFLIQGDAVSTPAHTRRTSLFIGGSGDTTPGGRGVATVSGAGSAIRVSGSDAYIGVGHGPLASGQLTLSNQAQAGATILGVGNFGGTGILRLDNARIDLIGQYTGSGEFGAALVVGAQTGAVGNVQLSGGSLIRIENPSGTSGGFAIGGSRTVDGGDGSVSLSGGSRIEVILPAGVGGGSVGRTGSGILRLSEGSSVDLGQNNLAVGAFAGSDGAVIATGGSTISATWVGVGRRRDSTTGIDVDGGTGTMVLNGATLNATDIVIGTNGYLGGSSGSINASGTITNHGIFSPGNSPGVFTINGHYTAATGSRLILEVQSDGQGGFLTDEVRFGALSTIDLGRLNVEFRFLGDTDPNAFQASGGFDIDTFVGQDDGTGHFSGLAETAFAGVSFSASAETYVFESFSYSAAGGATFTAVAVPEPGTWALWSAGLLALSRLRRRRSV